ncbi:hypothetical protein [Streptomyces sp. NPDC007929]|uniref:hypothetical protein n=1 Tax=unclassified Streptomyces TaxID=2593676 RepID=UPI0036E8DC78
MGTAERRGAPRASGAQLTGPQDLEAAERDISEGAAVPSGREAADPAHAAGRVTRAQHYRPLWVEEPARRRRLPDPVRTAAVRAVLLIAVTLIQAMVAFLCTLAGSWLAFPMVISSVVSTIAATWGALDVWVTRQVWNQRNGVVSVPSSTARALRRERRKARRQERATARTQERIRRRGGAGAGQLSHS